jgi:hypothetical protein
MTPTVCTDGGSKPSSRMSCCAAEKAACLKISLHAPRGARMARVVVAFECFLNRKGIISVVAGRVLSRQVVEHTFIIAQAIGLIALIPKNQRWGNAQLGDRRYSSVAAIECSGSPASTEPKAVAQKTGLQALADTINSLLPKEGVHFF